jgi:hypothetical protein
VLCCQVTSCDVFTPKNDFVSLMFHCSHKGTKRGSLLYIKVSVLQGESTTIVSTRVIIQVGIYTDLLSIRRSFAFVVILFSQQSSKAPVFCPADLSFVPLARTLRSVCVRSSSADSLAISTPVKACCVDARQHQQQSKPRGLSIIDVADSHRARQEEHVVTLVDHRNPAAL